MTAHPKRRISMQTIDVTTDELRALAGQLDGNLVLPGDDDYETARVAWNLAADQRPVAVAFPESADDVAAVVRFAAERGLGVAPQGTGHSAGAMAPLDDTILLKTTRLTKVEIDPHARRARVEAGAIWIDVSRAAAEHGLAALAGSSPNVGVVGYTTGGGLSWLARKHGLAANHVHAAEVVTADGRKLRIDHDSEPDLFWAIRGGGGSFAAVTALELELFPLTEVYAGWLIWPLARTADVLKAWAQWMERTPDEVTSCGRILRLPPLPDIPEPFRGRSFVAIEAVYLGDAESASELLAPLRALGPEMDTFAVTAAGEMSALHMDPVDPVPGAGDGMVLSELTPETIDALVSVAGPGRESPLLSVELRQLGGALSSSPDGCGAAGNVDGAVVIFSVGIAISPEVAAAIEGELDALDAALGPWRAPRAYLNFIDRPREAEALFDGDHARLSDIKAQYDPGHVFRANLPVRPKA
jgi:FAD binding domain/Berberine and berberine like